MYVEIQKHNLKFCPWLHQTIQRLAQIKLTWDSTREHKTK